MMTLPLCKGIQSEWCKNEKEKLVLQRNGKHSEDSLICVVCEKMLLSSNSSSHQVQQVLDTFNLIAIPNVSDLPNLLFCSPVCQQPKYPTGHSWLCLAGNQPVTMKHIQMWEEQCEEESDVRGWQEEVEDCFQIYRPSCWTPLWAREKGWGVGGGSNKGPN